MKMLCKLGWHKWILNWNFTGAVCLRCNKGVDLSAQERKHYFR